MKKTAKRLIGQANVRGALGASVVAMAVAVGVLVAPAHAQLAEITKAAGKLADKITGTTSAAPVSATTENSARITLLDKQTNRRQTLTLLATQPQVVGTVQIKLTKCLPDYAATLGQDVAWLDITESNNGSGRTAPWFSGWMFNTYPEVSTLDHARYDVILQGCGIKERKVSRTPAPAPILESAPPALDTETAAPAPTVDVEAGAVEETPATPAVPAGADPYYVPGVEKNPTTNVAPAAQPTTPAAPVAGPVEATPAAAQPATPEQRDLHEMMDSGQY